MSDKDIFVICLIALITLFCFLEFLCAYKNPYYDKSQIPNKIMAIVLICFLVAGVISFYVDLHLQEIERKNDEQIAYKLRTYIATQLQCENCVEYGVVREMVEEGKEDFNPETVEIYKTRKAKEDEYRLRERFHTFLLEKMKNKELDIDTNTINEMAYRLPINQIKEFFEKEKEKQKQQVLDLLK